MKKQSIGFIIVCALVLAGACTSTLEAQSNKKQRTTQTRTSAARGKQKVKPKPVEVPLPTYSNDCLFAIDLQMDIPFGPTAAPQGAGRVQEIIRDHNNPALFECEHNSVWYKITVPYNGDLEIAITQTNPRDDYDFLVYRYTDAYFSNHIIQNKVKPVAAHLASPDTTAKAGEVTIGMNAKGRTTVLTKNSTERFVSSIPVRKGEEYFIVLDNNSKQGQGHTITASIHVDFFTPTLRFYDPIDKKVVSVELLLLEKSSDNRAILKNDKFRGGKVKLVPNFNYTLYANAPGYFSVHKEFNSNICKEDTLMGFIMNRIKAGTKFPIADIYFGDEVELLPESDTVLMNYVAMMQSHPNVNFRIKGYVQSYGVDMEHDLKVSLERAQVVRQFFVDHGIDESRMSVAGMTQNEIKRTAAAVLNKTKIFNDAKVELIITEVKK